MARGTLSTFNALRDGRLQIRGDQLASQVLADVMQRIERTRHRGRARVEMESDEVTMLWRVGACVDKPETYRFMCMRNACAVSILYVAIYISAYAY